jgi:hypothetical protein
MPELETPVTFELATFELATCEPEISVGTQDNFTAGVLLNPSWALYPKYPSITTTIRSSNKCNTLISIPSIIYLMLF